MLGLDVMVEDSTNHGRVDLTVQLERRVFILEFKVVDQDTGKNSALEQIKEKAYHEKYRAEGTLFDRRGIQSQGLQYRPV